MQQGRLLSLYLIAIAATSSLVHLHPPQITFVVLGMLLTASTIFIDILSPRTISADSDSQQRVVGPSPADAAVFALGVAAALSIYSSQGRTKMEIVLLAAFVVFLIWLFSIDDFVRGVKVLTLAQAKRNALKSFQGATLYVAGLRLPIELANAHFCFIGAPGSGKTTGIRLLYQTLLPNIVSGSDKRAVIYDAMSEVLPKLYSPETNLQCEIIIANPFHAEGRAWDIADDVTDMATAREVAKLLIASDESQSANSAFFINTSRRVLAGCMRALMLTAPGEWTFTDLIIAVDCPVRLRSLLENCPATRSLVTKFCQKEETWKDVYSTLSEKLEVFREVAAIYRVASEQVDMFSIREWSETESILVLGNDKTRGESLDPLNKVFFHLLTKHLLKPNQRISDERASYVFLDELGQAGRLKGLNDLLTTGRHYGVCVVLGFQSHQGVTKPGLYSKEELSEILEQCATKVITQVKEETASWASKEVIGDAIYRERQGKSTSLVQRPAVLPSTLQAMKDLRNHKVFEAYCQTPKIGTWHAEIDGPKLFRKLHKPSNLPQHRKFIERDPSHQDESHLVWDEDDYDRLQIEPEEQAQVKEEVPEIEIIDFVKTKTNRYV
ncbi:MAG: type IV secretion system DNA-binding domain-containing protein [Planctomycetales bacterium]|nr:type IV secretion system DNA-binding domain-containing protein [Planctomycetales bacterium]